MQREIVTPADPADTALADLKDWLAITTSREDALLAGLLGAALETCEAFTRRAVLEATYEEVHRAATGWQTLGLVPVRAITQVERIAQDGSRQPLASDSYLLDIVGGETGRFRLLAPADTGEVAVRYVAGLAPGWAGLPAGLRQGMLRLAAHHYQARGEDPADALPPAAVAAMWHPWRRLRVA